MIAVEFIERRKSHLAATSRLVAIYEIATNDEPELRVQGPGPSTLKLRINVDLLARYHQAVFRQRYHVESPKGRTRTKQIASSTVLVQRHSPRTVGATSVVHLDFLTGLNHLPLSELVLKSFVAVADAYSEAPAATPCRKAFR